MEKFLLELKQFRHQWKKWLLRCIFIEFTGWFVIAMACLCWLDLFLAFHPGARTGLSGCIFVCLIIMLGIKITGVLRLSEEESATHADTLLQSRRREILSALEIGLSMPDKSSLSAYLAKTGIESARQRLQSIQGLRPDALLKKVVQRFLICLMIAFIPIILNPGAGLTLVSRYLLPFSDIPPYSSYVFKITPESPEVIYGADQIINVSVSGKNIHQPVRFVTRQKGRLLESECFQAGPAEYVQRLERVMQPIEFCFKLGKNRSKWHRLKVLYQPHVVSADVKMIPPAYSRKTEKQFNLGSESLKGLKRTQVELKLNSNRPLKKGSLTIKPADLNRHTRTIPGKITGKNEITFNWELLTNAQLSVMIRDIQGTSASKPLKIIQELVPDKPPEVSLIEPMEFSLATPEIKVPLYGNIEDDLGIQRCDIFKSLKGYRSRSKKINIASETESLEIQQELDLSTLGVEAGQIIELFIEASDTNPELTGTGASNIARIKIISEEEYAKIIRDRTTIETFTERFRIISKEYETLLKMLKQAESKLKNKKLSTESRNSLLREIQNKIKKTADSIQKTADDFVAFDLEKKLSKSASNLVDRLEKALNHPDWQSTDKEARLRAVSDTIKSLRKTITRLKTLSNDAEEIASVTKIMAMATWYRTLMDRQLILTSSLKLYASGKRKSYKPKVLAEHEKSIREDLNTLITTLKDLSTKLPTGYESLSRSSLAFVKVLWGLKIPVPMKACERACINEQPREAWRYAGQALEKMSQVLNKCKGSPFSNMCSGKLTFNIPNRLSQTMSQMLNSLTNQYQSGTGWGMSTGSAGVGIGGAWEGSYLNGYSAFSFPVYGPERKNPFSSAAMGKNGSNNGRGKGVIKKVQYNEVINPDEKVKTGGDGFYMESVPARYRNAVKSFYSGEK